MQTIQPGSFQRRNVGHRAVSRSLEEKTCVPPKLCRESRQGLSGQRLCGFTDNGLHEPSDAGLRICKLKAEHLKANASRNSAHQLSWARAGRRALFYAPK